MDQIKRISDSEIKVKLLTFTFKEDDSYVVLSPSLNLSGYGDSKEDAIESFSHILEDFINYSLNKKSLADNLVKLDWDFEKDEHPGELDYPKECYSKDKGSLKQLIDIVEYSTYDKDFELA